jgi:hypothetical protein
MSLETLLLESVGYEDKVEYGESEDEKLLFEMHLLAFTGSPKSLQHISQFISTHNVSLWIIGVDVRQIGYYTWYSSSPQYSGIKRPARDQNPVAQ